MKRSGLFLVLAGLVAVAFFVATDAGIAPRWSNEVGWSSNRVDAAADSMAGTVIGLAGAFALMAVGFWLVIRRSV